MTRIMATSDLHGFLDGLDEFIQKADVVVIAGDISPCIVGVNPVRFITEDFFGMVKRHPKVRFVMTPGNHDFSFDRNSRPDRYKLITSLKPDNLDILIDSGCEIDGVKFWGSPWVPFINGSWAFECMRCIDETGQGSEFLAEMFDRIPDGVDVLVTHTPPRVSGSETDVSVRGGKKSRHFGSSELTNAIKRSSPVLHFCGHIHTGTHDKTDICCMSGKVSTLEERMNGLRMTSSFNVSRVNEEYDIAYSPLLVAYDKQDRTWVVE